MKYEKRYPNNDKKYQHREIKELHRKRKSWLHKEVNKIIAAEDEIEKNRKNNTLSGEKDPSILYQACCNNNKDVLCVTSAG